MIQLLKEYAIKHGLEPKPGFAEKDIKWIIKLDNEGKLLGIVEIGDVTSNRNKGQTYSFCPNLSQPEMKVGGVTKSHFLADTLDVVTLYGTESDKNKIHQKHRYFKQLLRDASKVAPELMLIHHLLNDETQLARIQKSLTDSKAKKNDKVTFQIGEECVLESDRWHQWWSDFRTSLQKPVSRDISNKKSDLMVSFISGEIRRPTKTHNNKIKNLSDVGGRTSGDVLIGFNQEAFCSFYLNQSYNAAMSEEEADIYTSALNKLIKENSSRLVKTKIVHWFKEHVPPEDDPLPWLHGMNEMEELNAQHKARELLGSIKAGKRSDLQNNFYYALTLSGASGRVMVRDWMEGQFEELVENVNLWFDDLSIVHREGGTLANPPKLMAVLGATVRELRDLPAPLITKIWRTAVKAELIPLEVIAQALSRAKIDFVQNSPANHARMGLLKASHVRKDRLNGKEKTDMKPYLNEEHPDPAYHCGRIMAVLSHLQKSALPGVDAGIVQRYYAAASATPALVLGRLVRTSQFHLNKISEKPGLVYWYESKIADIWGRIKDDVPSNLTLEKQSLFALGYYHQMADLRSKKVTLNDNAKEKENE